MAPRLNAMRFLPHAAALAALMLGACTMPSSTDDTAASANPGAPEGTVLTVLIGGVSWYVDYDAAAEIARAQDKALWVHFGENPG